MQRTAFVENFGRCVVKLHSFSVESHNVNNFVNIFLNSPNKYLTSEG